MLQAGIAAVEGRAVTRATLQQLALPPAVSVFAVGKAAAAMALGAADALGPALRQALVITRDGHAQGLRRALPLAQLIESAHPLPDERSLTAGAALWGAVRSLPAGQFPLFLISGGASSLVEVLRPGVTLAQLQLCNAQGLASGLDIATLNRQRAGLSLLKGGGLAAALGARAALALFISDVAGDSPEVIGSGLLGGAGPSDQIERRIIASVDHARAAVVAAARAAGQVAQEREPRFCGDAVALAQRCVAQLRAGAPGLTVWGGESTVQLPDRPGLGGRNQQLALAAAIALDGSEKLLLLAAGTDGNDGNTEDAGALVDGGSCARMREQGIDPQGALRRADAGPALAESCDLIHTGPTGTNVGDLILGLALPPAASHHAASTAIVV
jgi:hydroxypyruvate reductase